MTKMNSTVSSAKATAKTNVRKMVIVAMLGAVSMILMWFEIPLWFAPPFYKMDLSEVPVMIGTFALGPVSGVFIELIKVVLKVITKGTTTAFVGDIANFVIGCSLIVPAGLVYSRCKSKKSAVFGMVVGTAVMTVAGCLINAYVMLPVYGKAFGMPMDTLVAMGSAVNPAIKGLGTFVILAVAPFNLLKGLLVSAVTLLLYKHVSPVLKSNQM
jgi:riboflavin transporter FmnP